MMLEKVCYVSNTLFGGTQSFTHLNVCSAARGLRMALCLLCE